jgi:hypothetical protein
MIFSQLITFFSFLFFGVLFFVLSTGIVGLDISSILLCLNLLIIINSSLNPVQLPPVKIVCLLEAHKRFDY